MRKLTTTVLFTLLVTTSAFAAAPRNESKDTPGPVARIVRKIIRMLDLGQPIPPTPEVPTTNQ